MPEPGPGSTAGERCAELWRRVRQEFALELPLLRERWGIILGGAVLQYVHGIFTQLAHRMAQPQAQPLHDLGFALLPELGRRQEWVSETLFGALAVLLVLWSFSPFVFRRKRFYTVLLYSRLLTTICVCQAMRIVSFTVTQLPSSNYHCRLGQAAAVMPWPAHWWGHLVVDVGQQVGHGCGDLIFSSHTIFALSGALAYNEFGSLRFVKAAVWATVAGLSVLILASRKHYTVDVVLAWFVVPMVFALLRNRWTTKRAPATLAEEGSDRLDEEGETLLPTVMEPGQPLVLVAAKDPVKLVSARPSPLEPGSIPRVRESAPPSNPYHDIVFGADHSTPALELSSSYFAAPPEGLSPQGDAAAVGPSPSRRLGQGASTASARPAHKRASGSTRQSEGSSGNTSENPGDEESLLGGGSHPRGASSRGPSSSASPVNSRAASVTASIATAMPRALGLLFGAAGSPRHTS